MNFKNFVDNYEPKKSSNVDVENINDLLNKFSTRVSKSVLVEDKNLDIDVVEEIDVLNNVESIVENEDLEVQTSSMLYLGEHHIAPNPLEQPVNSFYRNINEGIVYVKRDQLWEVFLRDGKNGSQGPQGHSGGSGTGVKEVQQIVNDAVSQIVISGGTLNSIEWSKVTNVPTASNTTSGVLSSQDWNTFNNKINSVSAVEWAKVTGVPTASSVTSGVLTSQDWTTFNNKLTSAITTEQVLALINNAISGISATSASVVLDNFIPATVSGVPLTSAISISASVSQRISIPNGYSAVRLTFRDFGPFTYKIGNSSVVATSSDLPASTSMQVVGQITGTHIAFYGIGSGSVVVEFGYNVSRTNFIPLYSSGSPKVSTLDVSASISQRVLIPSDCSHIRLTFRGFGPFSYRQGDGSVVAQYNDAPGDTFNQVVVPVVGLYLAVYGIGSGTVIVEGGVAG